MRGTITLLTILVLSTGAVKAFDGQDTQRQFTDANGLKQGYWIFTGATKKMPGYSETAKVEEGNFKDNLKQGLWIQYFPAGTIKNKVTFKDNRPEGYTISFFENGKTQEEGIWKNNRWVGDYKLCYENGVVQHQFHFTDNGKRDGNQKYFYPNGQVMIDGSWTGGKQAGATTEYYDDGTVKAKENFNNGTLDQASSQVFPAKADAAPQKTPDITATAAAKDAPKAAVTVAKIDEKPNLPEKTFDGEGYWKLYNRNKQIAKDGVFHGGHLTDGKEYIYNASGILQRIVVYKGGTYQGDAPITDEDKK
jgi:antitoxin component YwqK of YwqJK toxin-antitoxin module